MRLIDADAMKELWQGCEIKGSISPLLDVRPTVDAIIIPENATNGDMIKALFPNANYNEEWKALCHFDINDDERHTEFTGCGRRDWWNAPYKRSE